MDEEEEMHDQVMSLIANLSIMSPELPSNVEIINDSIETIVCYLK
jgi:hypothetical protein